ncbi:tetratricopeptide repeat protein [Novosphingobium sp. FGD1]|uniref:Tetratricopeptide repeat protein n=1 Tax=Novosphingobium silvae TaxID=2692619 RepID=A0A7X4GGI6_9SPHN|nr:tetratricopeptide repeat protein [Novosphingobium silvae]MYL97861.1 tetratricopeptide repeat protein [Novosphingobium silvae]
MNSLLRPALPFAALFALASCGESPEAVFRDAQTAFAQENYQEARLDLVEALRARPTDHAMLVLLAETHLRLGDPDSAEWAIGRLERAGGKPPARIKAEVALLRQDPTLALDLLGRDETVDGWRIRGEAYAMLGQADAARHAFEQGLKAGGNVRLGSAYGRELLLAEDFGAAGKVLARMRSLAPQSYETLVMAADLAAAQGQDEAAIAAYRRTIDAFPDRAAPMLALANQYDALGKVDDAISLVERAAKIDAGDPQVEELRFQLLSEKGEWEKIRLALQTRETSLQPGSALSMTYGEALLRLGHAEQARVIFRRAALVLPGNPYSRLMLGQAELATGDAQGAWKTLEPLAQSSLARPEVLVQAEQAARAAGAPEAAKLRARLEPARIKATMELVEQGEDALARQQWARAVAIYTRLLQRGEDAEVLKRLALAQGRLGDAASAIARADRAQALSPDNPDYLYVAGIVRLDSGRDVGEAVRLLERAAAIDPGNRAISRDLARAKAAAG